MHKLVYAVFKAIMMSVIFVFLFDMVFYAYRAFSINQRMETIMTSMQKVIMNNNYLPEGEYDLYKQVFKNLANDMNNGDSFVLGIGLNYDTEPMGHYLTSINNMTVPQETVETQTGSSTNNIRLKMSLPAREGDVMVVQARVRINQPFWGWSNMTAVQNNYNYQGEDAPSGWQRFSQHSATTFYYTYYVPCLKHQTLQ